MESKAGELAFGPPHPGEYIKEDILPALNMNATQLADHLGVSKQTVSNILNGKRPLSTDMAVRLGKAFRNGGRFWLALQMQHDLWFAERKGGTPVKPIDWSDDRAA
jgi:addiction module HigA family antidote